MADDDKGEKQLPAIRRTPGGTFAPGESGNLRGRPRGARGRLSETLLADFSRQWAQHGAAAITAMREKDPGMFVQVAAKLVPKEFLLSLQRPIDQMPDDELRAAALAERDTNALILAKVRELPGGAQLVEAAERAVIGDE